MIYWSETGDSCANSAVTVTHAAESGRQHRVTDLTVAVRGASSGNDIRVRVLDGCCTLLWDTYIDSARGIAVQESFNGPLTVATGKAAKVNIAAAGASAQATVSFAGYTQ